MHGDAVWPNHPWYMIFDETVKETGPIIMTERLPGRPRYITYNMAHELYNWSHDNSREIEKGWITAGEFKSLARRSVVKIPLRGASLEPAEITELEFFLCLIF
ncbi:MAG: hypothetical protein ABII06_05790 [Pseudomonadota bacterium]